MTRKIAWWVLNPPLGQTSAPGATVLIQSTASPDMPHDAHVPQWACPPFVTDEEGGVWRAAGAGHPDYASSYGLFTLYTKQYGNQRNTPQQQNNCSH